MIRTALAFFAAAVMLSAQCAPTLNGAAPIPSDFDTSTGLIPAAMPGTMGADPVGAFRFNCGAGQVNYDDSIVFPGKPGASHLHQYYGNDQANAFSTYASLRSTGESTCGNKVNRSAYWMPAMLDGKGHVVEPDIVSIYYKRLPASDPRCNDPSRTDLRAEGICVPIPNDIHFIFGYDMVSNTAPTGNHHFACVAGTTPILTGPNLAAVVNCPAGDKVEAMISAPECWDGRNLDSPNHRSHVAYPSYGNWGYLRCDAAHPYLMPTFTLGAFYSISAGDDVKLWHLSSDEMRPGVPAGTTFHADYREAWDPAVKQMWTDNCLNKHLNCSSGNLGNGLQIKGAWAPSYGFTNPNRLISVPPKPSA